MSKRRWIRPERHPIINWRNARLALFIVLGAALVIVGISIANRGPVQITRYERGDQVGCRLSFDPTWVEVETYLGDQFVRRQIFERTDNIIVVVVPELSNTVYLYDETGTSIEHILKMKPDCNAIHVIVAISDE